MWLMSVPGSNLDEVAWMLGTVIPVVTLLQEEACGHQVRANDTVEAANEKIRPEESGRDEGAKEK